ncbi:FKBP-type peptidyl-prolyl cis-trans isomerase [Breznakiella homolactica]|uniref:Peptidyl-prolyl cis-trans isomerase n=1 Tax=Breznakiella homolactica TaxID=2798577 RepID=A0A7T8BC14_9SPIR|nr:FKBP-type peptidyl-prolyl cis-trans isomerase [Breznakiella homolactica]QQO10956.1 FKBP-type peptidyl-prolyl cis-trans isomerase [Breznakiella homolactica]
MVKRVIIAFLLASSVLFACSAKGSSDKEAETGSSGASSSAAGTSADADTSYAFGVALGSDLRQVGLEFDYDAFTDGFRDAVEGGEMRMTIDEAVTKIQFAFMAAMAKQAEENLAAEQEFLAENGKKAGVMTTASGLQYEIVSQGTGPRPGATDVVLVNYEGTLLDGTVFDSSYARGAPAEFPLNQVIPGWAEGILLMNVGGTARLYIPAALAYGEQGAGNIIPPNTMLIFDVELLSIQN